jgi:hypothetical protein
MNAEAVGTDVLEMTEGRSVRVDPSLSAMRKWTKRNLRRRQPK